MQGWDARVPDSSNERKDPVMTGLRKTRTGIGLALVLALASLVAASLGAGGAGAAQDQALALPRAQTFYMSLTDTYMASARPAHLVGLTNYAKLAQDPDFWSALGHTLFFTLASVVLEFILGLGIALVIHSHFKGRGLVRAAILIPWALPTIVSARIWSFMLVDSYGVINDLLVTRLGLLDEKIAWLARPELALGAIVAVDVWKTTPFVALILLAGLQLIPKELDEAAQVDGASPVQRFWLVTLPLLKPSILVALVFRTLDALRVFDAIWVLTRGEVNTESLATYNYRHLIDFRKLGYGSAVSVTIFVLIGVFVALYVFLLRSREES
jgi:trehalose/maltose transport system permease protein